MKANLDFLRGAEERDSWDPPSLFTQSGRRSWRWPPSTCAASAASAGPGDGVTGSTCGAHPRLRRRARRHRAVRPPARVQPDVRGIRPAGPLVGRGLPGEAPHRRRQGAAWRACSPPSSSRRPGLPADPRASRPPSPPGTAARRRSTPAWWPPAPSRPGRASPASSPRRSTRAGRWPSPPPRPSPRSRPRWNAPSAPEHAPGGQRVRRRHRAAQEAGARTSTCSPCELGVPADRAVVVEDSRNGLLAATGPGLPA